MNSMVWFGHVHRKIEGKINSLLPMRRTLVWRYLIKTNYVCTARHAQIKPQVAFCCLKRLIVNSILDIFFARFILVVMSWRPSPHGVFHPEAGRQTSHSLTISPTTHARAHTQPLFRSNRSRNLIKFCQHDHLSCVRLPALALGWRVMFNQ